MPRYVDLSHAIHENMPIHPYDDSVKLFQDKFLHTDKYNNFRLETGMHSGTHIDSPMHLIESTTFINEIPLDSFIGNGCLLDVRNETVITFKEDYLNKVSEGDIVLVYTDHSTKYGTDAYYEKHPIIDEKLAEFFIEKKIKMLGMDIPSPDEYPFEVHQSLFKHNILLIENMTNLSVLKSVKDFEVFAIPLKIKAEASLARVFAKIKQD